MRMLETAAAVLEEKDQFSLDSGVQSRRLKSQPLHFRMIMIMMKIMMKKMPMAMAMGSVCGALTEDVTLFRCFHVSTPSFSYLKTSAGFSTGSMMLFLLFSISSSWHRIPEVLGISWAIRALGLRGRALKKSTNRYDLENSTWLIWKSTNSRNDEGSARPAEEEPGSCWGLSRALGALPMVTSSVGGAEDAPSAGQLFRSTLIPADWT
ncbi:uncharacterized protein LOC111098147 [Canis lupus familiaris]|uniref:uncharacterized protein LOC111098147 n=1 Tax=Canis lupus familiaris TaxID=9615 RepID=UPI000DC74A09|nr:uncharacterized protein LOC111098147 [Canis lupus familiaris]XP_038540202.1 uncharacterized protein LOC111098147 [Canis lupus familiaris]XP_038541513.1 uncharacterized protein LOC111098147 [Canis lupus familiaris]